MKTGFVTPADLAETLKNSAPSTDQPYNKLMQVRYTNEDDLRANAATKFTTQQNGFADTQEQDA